GRNRAIEALADRGTDQPSPGGLQEADDRRAGTGNLSQWFHGDGVEIGADPAEQEIGADEKGEKDRQRQESEDDAADCPDERYQDEPAQRPMRQAAHADPPDDA